MPKTVTKEQVKLAQNYAEVIVRDVPNYIPEMHEKKQNVHLGLDEFRRQIEKAYLSGITESKSEHDIVW